ncbi:PREDICTED: coiled-coil domain-containing protein 69, partial [Apaloderma vittatum]|uniref:coiled-coil domain-containing protein 69 n=1 Tax=Apaloderma vittatum TaxID=57397 RepID=UPI0005219D46
RQLKAQQQKGPDSQELTALKTENAYAVLLPDDGKEKGALREERTESGRLLQGQEEEEERLRGAGRAGAARTAQDVNIVQGAPEHPLLCPLPASQVEKGKDLDLEEQFDALRKEHMETLQGACWDRRAPRSPPALLAESHHRSQEALQETIQVLNSQLKSFQERMKRVEESLLSTDYKKHIQEHGSPSPFWEQELESLHFVIEMKNEHIHSLDKKLLNLETVAERNLLLEEKVKTLQQENEDLQVRTQNHLVMARRLAEELLAARGALEKEAQLREQAHREKEELLYRVLNEGDGCPFPITAGEVPLIAT